MTTNSWNSQNPAQVARGGTGVAATTPYAVQCGGTIATNPMQSIAGVGTAGQVLTSNGAGALPTFQTNSAAGCWQIISTVNAAAAATVDFLNLDSASLYALYWWNLRPGTDVTLLTLVASTDNGTSWNALAYRSGMQVWGYDQSVNTNLNSATLCYLNPSISNTRSGAGHCFISTSEYSCGYGDSTSVNTTSGQRGCSVWSVTTATEINAIRLLMTADVFSKGIFELVKLV